MEIVSEKKPVIVTMLLSATSVLLGAILKVPVTGGVDSIPWDYVIFLVILFGLYGIAILYIQLIRPYLTIRMALNDDVGKRPLN
jgi:hypothetical protein